MVPSSDDEPTECGDALDIQPTPEWILAIAREAIAARLEMTDHF